MTKTTFKVTYFIRKNKPLSNGEVPIVIRITLNGDRIEFNGKHSVHPDIWDQKTNRAVGKSAFAKSVNTYLDHVYIQLCDSMRDLENRGIKVTAKNVRDNYLGLMEEKVITLFSLYNEHNEKMTKLLNKAYALSTLEKHFTTVSHLKAFLKKNYKANDIEIEKVDNIFLSDFQFFLRSDQNIGNNTANKYMKNIGKILRIAFNAGHINRNPLNSIKLHNEEVDRPFLDKDELQRLCTKEIEIERLSQIRDIFAFCCFTGLAFVDAQSLTSKDLYTSPSGTRWIKKQRQKTKKWSHIPLLPQAETILDKYKKHPIRRKGYLLPFPTNQKMNAYLKEIATICGIKKNLSTHTARHIISSNRMKFSA